ncbi:MAG: SpoIIE family protein phosphatase [Deltaproteobacteria bacterium]|nr:SpoIIE family protein phosphatase [Deltaproteobacteria bacterium]MBK8717518.1 SpoIIE family protein phosphatase [Deltaproteobacteria bacterium]
MFTASLVASDRAHPEDAVLVIENDAGTALVVADGAGGIAGGARAAQLVIASFAAAMADAFGAPPTSQSWCRFLCQLDEQLARDAAAGEATAVVASIHEGVVVGASVGDSEAWLVSSAERRDLTAAQQKARLGSNRASPVGFEATVVPDSIMLAATDGLFRSAPADAICSALRGSPSPSPAKLVALARSSSGKLYDDVGLVVVASMCGTALACQRGG